MFINVKRQDNQRHDDVTLLILINFEALHIYVLSGNYYNIILPEKSVLLLIFEIIT